MFQTTCISDLQWQHLIFD